MNGFLIGDAVTGAALLSVALKPAMGIAGFVNDEGNEKVAAGATAAFAFAFLHRAAEASVPKSAINRRNGNGSAGGGLSASVSSLPPASSPRADRKGKDKDTRSRSAAAEEAETAAEWWREIKDVNQLPTDFFETLTMSESAKRRSEDGLMGLGGGSSNHHMLSPLDVPPNASPIPRFAQTNPDGTEVTMHFYLHPALPLFCLAVDTVSQSKNDYAGMGDEDEWEDNADDEHNARRGIGNDTTTANPSIPMGAYVSAAMANCFIRRHGRTFLKSLLSGQPIKSTDLKAIKKAVLPSMKAVYRAAVTDMIRSVVGGVIGDLLSSGPTAAATPIAKDAAEAEEEECYFELTVEADGLNSLKPPGSPIGTPSKPPRPTAAENSNGVAGVTVDAPLRKTAHPCHPVALLSSSLFLVNFETPIEDVGAFRALQQDKNGGSKKVKKTAEEKAAEKTNKNSGAASAAAAEKKDLAPVVGLFFITPPRRNAPPSALLSVSPARSQSFQWAAAEGRRQRQTLIMSARIEAKRGINTMHSGGYFFEGSSVNGDGSAAVRPIPTPIFPASLLLLAGGGGRRGGALPSSPAGGTFGHSNAPIITTTSAADAVGVADGNVNSFNGIVIPSSIAKLFSHVRFPKVNCSTQVDIVGPWSAAGGGSLDMIGGPILRIEASATAASGGISGRPSKAQLKDEARRGMAVLSTAATMERLEAAAAAAVSAADGVSAVGVGPTTSFSGTDGFPSLPHTTHIHRFTAAIAFSPVFTASLRLMFRVVVKTDDDELLYHRRGNGCDAAAPPPPPLLPSAAEAQRFIGHLTERIVGAVVLAGQQRMADCLKVLYDNGIPLLMMAGQGGGAEGDDE